MFSILLVIFFEVFLSFIGLGLCLLIVFLGILLNEGYKIFCFFLYLMWILVVIFLVIMICFNLLVDGLCDVFDFKMKE